MNTRTTYFQKSWRLFLALIISSGLLGIQSASPAQAAEGDLLWVKAMSGTGNNYGIDISIDNAGNIYIVGAFEGTVDFDPGAGTTELTSAGDFDIFITKLDNNGDLVWVKSVGGPGFDENCALTIDASGNVYVIGDFEGTADFGPGAGTTELTSVGSYDIFILKLDSNGNLI